MKWETVELLWLKWREAMSPFSLLSHSAKSKSLGTVWKLLGVFVVVLTEKKGMRGTFAYISLWTQTALNSSWLYIHVLPWQTLCSPRTGPGLPGGARCCQQWIVRRDPFHVTHWVGYRSVGSWPYARFVAYTTETSEDNKGVYKIITFNSLCLE